MKFSDDLFDINHNVKDACKFGVLCGVTSALAACYNVDAAYIFIAILIGNIIALKVDGIHHILTLIVFIVICLLAGIPELNLVILLICILGTLADEVGHELISDFTDNKFLNLFFEYRFVLKIVLCLLAICGVFNICKIVIGDVVKYSFIRGSFIYTNLAFRL